VDGPLTRDAAYLSASHNDMFFTFNDERGSLIVEGLFFARGLRFGLPESFTLRPFVVKLLKELMTNSRGETKWTYWTD
jgi:hypothetical protein